METVLAVALYTSAGLLIAYVHHPPILLIVILVVQASVYLSTLVAALWNVRAQRVPGVNTAGVTPIGWPTRRADACHRSPPLASRGALFLAIIVAGTAAILRGAHQAQARPGRNGGAGAAGRAATGVTGQRAEHAVTAGLDVSSAQPAATVVSRCRQ